MRKFIKLLLCILSTGMILISGDPSPWAEEQKQSEVAIPRKPLPENALITWISRMWT